MPPLDAPHDLPPGKYQAEISGVIQETGVLHPPETIVMFRLTDPDDPKNLQKGLGGRIARAWFELNSENPETARIAQDQLEALLNAANALDIEDAIGSIIWIRLARVVRRSDPSRYKIAAVEFFSLVDTDTQPFVE